MQPKYRMANEPIIYTVDLASNTARGMLERIRWMAESGQYSRIEEHYDIEQQKMVYYCWPANTTPKKKEKRQSTWRRRIK